MHQAFVVAMWVGIVFIVGLVFGFFLSLISGVYTGLGDLSLSTTVGITFVGLWIISALSN